MIFPLSREEFFERIYCKKAFVVRGGSQKRFSSIIKDQMFNLNVLKLLQKTSSKQIHVWNQPTKKNKDARVNSIPTPSPDEAYKSYQNGASLYFAANIGFDTMYMKSLNY